MSIDTRAKIKVATCTIRAVKDKGGCIPNCIACRSEEVRTLRRHGRN